MGRVRNQFAAVVTTVALVAFGGAAAAVFGLSVAAPAAGAATKGSEVVTADPAAGSKLAPRGRYYEFTATPGQSVTQTVHIVNNNPNTVDVRVAGLDGYTSNATGAAYTTPGETATRTGTWIVVSTPEMTLQPGQPRNVSFTVQVPPGTKPGQYLGAVGMWVPLSSSTTTLPGNRQAGFAVTLQGERVIAVEIIVPGPTQASLAVNGVTPLVTPSGIALQVRIANTGNAFTKGSGVVTVADTQLDYPFSIDTFVSHTAIVYGVPWTRTVVPGAHQVSVKLTYDGNRVTTWNGTVTISGALQRQLESALHHTQVGAPEPPRDWSHLLLMLGLLVVLACVAGAVLLRRRSDRTPALAR